MKKSITFLMIFALLFSCKEEKENLDTLDELKIKKENLVQSIDSLSTILKSVEQSINLLDTKKSLQMVKITTPKQESFKHYIEIQGVVKADKNIELRPELGGTIVKIYVKEGQKVKKGQTLIQLDDSAVQKNIAELKTQMTLGRTTFERQKRLWDQKIGSEMQYLQAKTQMESLENNMDILENQASKMRITAPFSGVVDEIFPKNGELTSPQVAVLRLVNLDNVYVQADVTESYLPHIKQGNQAIISFPSIDQEYNSKVSQVGNVINPNNRSFKIKINLNNNKSVLKPNLLADIKIIDFEQEGIIIPASIIQIDREGNSYVFVVKHQNSEYEVSKKIVTIASEYDHNVLIEEGLTAQDTIVSTGSRIIKEGDLVNVIDQF